jgi:hypothetical protein
MDLADMFNEPPPKRYVDNSGRPCPTRAFVTLSSGVVVDAVVVYGGVHRNDRRYRVVAELDWATANVVMVEVDRWPPDVQITMRVPDDWDDMRCIMFGRDIEWKVAGVTYRPTYIERHSDL